MINLVFEEEVHQFIQVVLTFNSKGLGETGALLRHHSKKPTGRCRSSETLSP